MFGCLLLVVGGVNSSCDAKPQPQADAQASIPKSSTNETVSQEAGSTTQPANSPASSAGYDNSLGRPLLRNLADDQKTIWTSPVRVRLIDADWLVPLGVAMGAMLATDTAVSRHLSNSPGQLSKSNDVANYGVASLAAAAGGLYLWGRFTHEEHKRETGFLAGEAVLNSLAVTYALNYSLGRERPLLDNYRGNFWAGGNSFPSEHSAAAWSIAGVIAHEYPGPLTTVLSYGLASAISAARVNGKQHFPSDALVGSAIGWFVAQEVYRHHHDPSLDGGEWETYAETQDQDQGSGRTYANTGSPYVELDSWVYPAIEKLAAMGYIHSEYLDMRPFTRLECANLVDEAGDAIHAQSTVPGGAEEIYFTLEKEFQKELDRDNGTRERSLQLESVYTDITGISGTPLNDSDHFGETIINNYGRPYEGGFNTWDGFSGYGTEGRFTIYVRGEYQYAPGAPAYPLAVREAIAEADVNPLQPATPVSTASQFRLLDTYVAGNVGGWNLAFGKQSLWWGPGDGGALLFSNNAEPIYMFRANTVAPVMIPLASRLLGPMKFDFFFGKLSGNEFPARPLMHGEKISFKMTKNFEIGFSRTSELGGVGRPITAGAIWNSYTSIKSSVYYSTSKNPGKRSSGVDFSYKVPFVRNWLTVYADSFAADDVLPLAAPRRAAWVPGFYVPRIPRLNKLDFRLEAGYTDIVTSRSNNGNFVYWDQFYHDLYTNKNNIVGSWMGREGKGVQAWTTYWFTSRNSLQFGFREAKVAKDFIPGGETIDDGSVKVNWRLGQDFSLSGLLQYEKWVAPLLASGPQTNWTSSVDFVFTPHSWGW